MTNIPSPSTFAALGEANDRCAASLRRVIEALCGAHSPAVRHDNPSHVLADALCAMDPDYDRTAAAVDAMEITTQALQALDARQKAIDSVVAAVRGR